MTTHDDTTAAFALAVEAHQHALEAYGEDDPRTVEALLAVMALCPDELFDQLEELARSTIH